MEQKISIIIPAYNIENYLGKTLDSVLAQTYQNIEVIVVNDGSKDGTGKVVDDYAAHDSRVIAVHKENGGVTSARLRGIAAASGDWIGFVDGDDYIEPDMYERLMRNAREYNVEISHCGYQMVLPSGKIMPYYGTGKLVLQDNHAGMKDLLEGKFIEPGLVNKIFARCVMDCFMRDVDFDCTIRNNEDLLMNYYLFRESKSSVFEDVCPYHYVLRKGSAACASINANQLQHPLKVKKILFQETEGTEDLHAVMGNHLVRQLVMLSVMSTRENKQLIRPIRRQARRELRGMLKAILTQHIYSKKIKIMALWASILPSSYRWVHKMYAVMKGIDNIYEK